MRKPNSKIFDKKKAQLVKTLKKAAEITEFLAKRQAAKGKSPYQTTASRWVGNELEVLIGRAEALNE